MTLSRTDLVFDRLSGVRSVQQLEAVPWLLNNSLKGLILRQEVEDREERKSRSDCRTVNHIYRRMYVL